MYTYTYYICIHTHTYIYHQHRPTTHGVQLSPLVLQLTGCEPHMRIFTTLKLNMLSTSCNNHNSLLPRRACLHATFGRDHHVRVLCLVRVRFEPAHVHFAGTSSFPGVVAVACACACCGCMLMLMLGVVIARGSMRRVHRCRYCVAAS